MATTVTMPQLGETVTEGTILKWAKKVGDTIVEDEVLVEISTDKVDTEVPSPASGTILEILVAEGDTVQVGTPLVVIEGADEESAAEQVSPPSDALGEVPPEPEPEVSAEPVSTVSDTSVSPPRSEATPVVPPPETKEEPEPDKLSTVEVEAFFAEPDATESKPHLLSPVVRKLIREHEIDASQLTGTGQGGRITRKDVDAYLVSAPVTPEPAPAAAPALPEPVPTQAAAPTHADPAAIEGALAETVELDRMRVRIANNMMKAKQSAAHVWTSVEVDFERIERLRQARKAQFKANEGFSLTYLPFISRATIDALKAFPVVNSSFNLEEKTATFHKNVDLGIATDTVVKRPTVITTAEGQDTIAIRHIGYLGLSWDHRALDGSTAVLFLNRIKENLETWDWEQELA